jgi:hypothetical protein
VEDPRSKGVDNINAKTNALLVISFGYISIWLVIVSLKMKFFFADIIKESFKRIFAK